MPDRTTSHTSVDEEGGSFRPVRISVKPAEATPDGADQVAVVAETEDGQYRGILAPTAIVELLDQFLPTSGARFLEFWKTYEAERGGDCFFDDFRRMLDAVASTPDLPALRKLTGARSAADFMHNAYQAHLMAMAHRLRLGAVDLVTADGRAKAPDFSIAREGQETVPCEVKIIARPFVIDLTDDGTQLGAEEAQTVVQRIRAKIGEASAQAVGGCVVVAIACDSAGAILGAVLSDWEVAEGAAFAAGRVVLTFRHEQRDVFCSFSAVDAEARLAELLRRLGRALPSVSIPFTSAVSVAKGMQHFPAGRAVALRNRMTPIDYADEQIADVCSRRPFQDVPLESLRHWEMCARLPEDLLTRFVRVPGRGGNSVGRAA